MSLICTHVLMISEDFWDANIATTKTPAGVRVFYIAASPDIVVNSRWEYE